MDQRPVNAFFHGTLDTAKIADNWRVAKLELHPEHLVFTNIGGHQGWQHSDSFMAVWYVRTAPPVKPEPWKEPWQLHSLRYERRTVTAVVRHAETKQAWTIRMARTMEGSWVLLGMLPSPNGLPASPIP